MSEVTIRHLVPILHGTQTFLALIVMGLDAYGIQYVAYNVSIYSLVVAICTTIICAYSLLLHHHPKPWHNNVNLIHSLWMLIFWIIDLGLIADLAKTLTGMACSDDLDSGKDCGKSNGSNATKVYIEPTTSFAIYHGALIAGVVLAVIQVILWGTTSILFWIECHKPSPPPSETSSHNFAHQPIQNVHPTAIRVPTSPDSPRLHPRRQSEFTTGAKSSAMTINFDDDLPGVLRSGPEPIIPDDSESEGTLRHVVEDLRRKSHGLGIHPPDMVTETVDGAGERVEGSVGARGGVVLGDGVGPARMDDVPL